MWPLRPPYKAELVTIGPGRWLFTYFGHNALRLVNYRRGRDLNFNFGTFSGARPFRLLMDYIRFEMDYWLGLEFPGWAIRRYQHDDRTYTYRRLLLRPEEMERLAAWLEEHAKPQNREYRYHHYLSNCSTKLRDALTHAIGPTFRKMADIPTGWTYRRHVMEQMKPNPIVMVLMDFGMGPFADKPLTRWEDMFLPAQLEAYVSDPFWTKLRGAPLVSESTALHTRQARPPLAWQPVPLVYGGLLLWLLLAWRLYRKDSLRLWLRWSLLFLGLLGTILFLMMTVTKMPEPPWNANLLLFHPVHLVAWFFLSKRRWQTPSVVSGLRMYFSWNLALGFFYLVAKGLSLVPVQANLPYVFVGMAICAIGAARFSATEAR